nr:hypothetical protein [Paraflavitalea speifideiaquila]
MESNPGEQNRRPCFFDFIVPVILVLTSYYIPFLELRDAVGMVQTDWQSTAGGGWTAEGALLVETSLFLYSATFGALVLFINQRWIRSRWLAVASLLGIGLLCCLFLAGTFPFSMRQPLAILIMEANLIWAPGISQCVMLPLVSSPGSW